MSAEEPLPESNPEQSDEGNNAAARRPVGLAEGQFVVPDDFDDPLPPEIQRYFEGYEDPMC